jgi:hypothetical protein
MLTSRTPLPLKWVLVPRNGYEVSFLAAKSTAQFISFTDNGCAGYDRDWNARRSIADGGGQEFLLAERHGIGSNLAERKAK